MIQLSLLPQDKSVAAFSECRRYRYTLWRRWGDDWESNYCMFTGLNPSTADEVNNDPTVKRCINFAKGWGYSALCMTNAFGYRATDPRDMMAVPEPVGEENDKHLVECATGAGIVIAAWGNHGTYRDRDQQVIALIPGEKLHCLKVTSTGMPGHPLYLLQTLKPVIYQGRSSQK